MVKISVQMSLMHIDDPDG